MGPRVDVGVVTWNTGRLTAELLRRLLDSDQGCNLRVLVYDNASEDDTADLVAHAVPEAELVRGGENLGFAAGVNALLQYSDSPWFFLLNSDAWPQDGALATLVRAGLARPDAGVVVPKLLRPDGTIEHGTHPFPSLTIATVDALGARRILPRQWAARHCLEGAWDHDLARPVDWAVGAAWLMRRQAIDDVGGLDERFFMYGEDLEWCWRAHTLGWCIWFEPAAVVRHIGNVSGERRFGPGRSAVEEANFAVVLEEILGPRRAAWHRKLQLLAAGEHYLLARARGDEHGAGHWRQQFRAIRHGSHLRASPGPATTSTPGGALGPR